MATPKRTRRADGSVSCKCLICEKKFVNRKALVDHIERIHKSQIPKEWSASRYENYLRTGKTEGKCVICGKPTPWNPVTEKYGRMCGSDACRKIARERASKNYIGLHGKPYTINDPEQQKKMVYSRKNAGVYVFEDETTGKKYDAMYDSSYGRDFFEMLDTFLFWPGSDIMAPSPHTYYYEYEGKKHFYIPDAYIYTLNAEIELKDGGSNPNTHPKILAVDKVKEKLKDDVMNSLAGQVNYIKICDKNYAEFFAKLAELRSQDTSIPKWTPKLSHVTESYVPFDANYGELFHSYYLHPHKVDNPGIDEECFSKTLQDEINNALSNCASDGKGDKIFYVYTMGADFYKTYRCTLLGAIHIYWYDKWEPGHPPKYDYEWDYQEEVKTEECYDLQDNAVQEASDSVTPKINLLRRHDLLTNPVLNYEALIEYYRKQLFHKRLNKKEWDTLYNELLGVRDSLKVVINGNNENDKRLNYEAKDALTEVERFIAYMEGERTVKESVDVFTSGDFSEYAKYADLDSARGEIPTNQLEPKVLTDYQRMPITADIIREYGDICPELNRNKVDTSGYIWIDPMTNTVVGFIRARKHEWMTWLADIKVEAGYQGRSLGDQMMDIAKQDLGVHYLTVSNKNDAAISLFRKHGFGVYSSTDWCSHMTDLQKPSLETTTFEGFERVDPLFTGTDVSTVYFTNEITPESLVRIYHALGVEFTGKVAVKISTGEPGGHNFLQPTLIKDLVHEVDGTIVECNTAYPGKRNTTEAHLQTFKDHGFTDIAECMLMDKDGELSIDVNHGYHLKENFIGEGLRQFDSMIVLSHFKGHQMAGYGGALKNMSIGVASSHGKVNIHTAGRGRTFDDIMSADRSEFQESMADADKSVMNYMGRENIVYINVANKLSVDCDCDANPHDPEMGDIGIFASLDPVAVDQACIDAVYNSSDEGKRALIDRIESRNGIHTIEAACNLELGNRVFKKINIDSGEYMMEGVASHINPNFVKKEQFSLARYKSIPISKDVLNKYKKRYPTLKHVRENDGGMIWLDGDDVVAVFGAGPHRDTTNPSETWIYSFEITPNYRGHGLSRQILNVAIKDFNARYLSVAKNNQVALELYKKMGFVTYGENKDMWFMKLKGSKTPKFAVGVEEVTSASEHHPIRKTFGDDEIVISNPSLDKHFMDLNRHIIPYSITENALPKETELADIIEFNKATNNMEYIVPNNGSIITQVSEEDYYKYYRLLSPEEFEKYNGGVCWDYVLYEAKYFDKFFQDVWYKTFYFCSERGNSHTFLIFELDGIYYWYESSWKVHVGIYGFRTEKDAVDYVTNLLLDDLIYRENNGVPMRGYVVEYDVDEIKVGSRCMAYMNHMIRKIDKIGDRKCLVKRRTVRPIRTIKGKITYESTIGLLPAFQVSSLMESFKGDQDISFGKSESDILDIIKTMTPTEQLYLGTPGGIRYNWSRSEFYQEVLYVSNTPVGFLVVSEIPANRGVGHMIIGIRAGKQYRHKGYASMLITRFINSNKIPFHITSLEWGFDDGNVKSEHLAAKFGFSNPVVPDDQVHHRGYVMTQKINDMKSVVNKEVIRKSLIREENWYQALESTYIEANRNEQPYFPVFIFLSYTGTRMAQLIKSFTHDPYAHSSISFDTTLENMISFNRDGMVVENIKDGIWKKNAKEIKYSLYMYMATAQEYDAMKQFVDELLMRKGKLKYNLLGLTNFVFGRGSEREDKFFCSEFVASVISAGNNTLLKQSPHMTTPYNLAKNKNFIFIKKGILSHYDQTVVDKIIAEKLEEGGFGNVIIK